MEPNHKTNHYNQLRNRILAGMILTPAVPYFLVLAVGFYFFMNSIESITISRMTRVVEDHHQMIESFLDERKSDLCFIADSNDIFELTQNEKLAEVFSILQKNSIAFTDIGVFDSEGLHLAYHGPFHLAGKNYYNAEWFQKVVRQDVYVSDVFLGYRQAPHFIIAVTKIQNNKKWVIRATMDTSLFSAVVEKIRIGKTGEAYIVNKDGLFQTARRSGGDLMTRAPDLGLPMDFKGVKTFVQADEQGEKYLYVVSKLKTKDWLLIARQEKAEAFKVLTRVAYMVVLITSIGGLLIVFIAFEVTNHIIRRMKETDLEKKELGKQLVVAGRLAEIGEMSAGFAHEINNPLQIIKSELTLINDIIKDMLDSGSVSPTDDLTQVFDSLNQIKSQTDRCGGITQGLLKFARQKETKACQVDIPSFLPGVVALVEKKARVEGIAITRNIPDDLPPVYADPAHLEQVLINLLNNAIYAISEKSDSAGGEILVTAVNGQENHVHISISDNGVGISPENIEKIFTPFFTTKPVGKGTGLGLSICYGIIGEMGGIMDVQSELGKGAAFSLYLKSA